MKKALSLILALVLCLSLCACGNNDQTGTPEAQASIPNNPVLEPSHAPSFTAPIDPDNGITSDADQTLLNRYSKILSCLEAATIPGEVVLIYDWDDGSQYAWQDALRYCYEQLQGMEAVDSLLGDDVADRQALLSGFTVIRDQKLRKSCKSEDNLGNVSEGDVNSWTYDAEGRMNYVYDASLISEWEEMYRADGSAVLSYDEDGYLIEIKFMHQSMDIVYAILTYHYNEQKQLTHTVYKTNYEQITYNYTFNSDGKVSKIEWIWGNGGNIRYWITFAYEGDLLKERIYYQADIDETDHYWYEATVYTYDEKGHLSSSTKTVSVWFSNGELRERTVYNSTFVCDEQGRVIQQTNIPGPNATYKNLVYTFHYGDYYIYSPAQ